MAGVADGIVEGIAEGIAEGIEKLIKTVRDLGASKSAACVQLVQKYELNEEEANEKIEQYWKDWGFTISAECIDLPPCELTK